MNSVPSALLPFARRVIHHSLFTPGFLLLLLPVLVRGTGDVAEPIVVSPVTYADFGAVGDGLTE